MDLQVGVKILLKNDEGKHLLVCRSKEKYPTVGALWDLVGGRINTGLSLLANLKREVFEETSLQITGVPKLVCAQDIMRGDMHVVRLTYTGTANGGVVLDEENTDYGWFSIDEIKNLENPDPYLKEFINNFY